MKSYISNTIAACIGVALTTPVAAGLIYTWETDSGQGASGQIEFKDNVSLGDIVGASDINSNLFSFIVGTDTFTFTDSFIPYSSMEVSSLGLCVPSCTDPGTATKKTATPKSTSFLSMNVLSSYDTLWSWQTIVAITPPPGTKAAASKINGSGRWVSDSSISVPEPGSVLLLLTGLVSFSFFKKKLSNKS